MAGIVPRMLLVYGPRSGSYDFGPGHPLTPRRFGPGIDLLRAVGAEPGLAPEPASDGDLLWCHTSTYIDTVRRFSTDPRRFAEAGIAVGGDDPPFAGMHEAAAMVAGGSLRGVEAVLRGDEEHAFHPGGGLHHAMSDRASGFCIYDDPALAIARARRDGLRVLYVDLDVHHGDGVQTIHWADPGVMTLSFHESGRYLFPGTGEVGELGEGAAAGTAVNVPLEPRTGDGAWLAAVQTIFPEVAAAFGPDLIVSQHGADAHAWDPLAHLRVTTTAMGEAARLVDRVAHRYAGGRWLATGGGGYDAYRVVPRSWSLVWLAGAHREAPTATPVAWRERWTPDALRYGQAPLPSRFEDDPNAGLGMDAAQIAAEAVSHETIELVRRLVVPRLLRVARDRGWWDPVVVAPVAAEPEIESVATVAPTIVGAMDQATWARLSVARGVIAPADHGSSHALIGAGLGEGLRVTAAVVGATVVGAAISSGPADPSGSALLALGVAPPWRRQGLAGRILAAHVEGLAPGAGDLSAEISVAERDPLDPVDVSLRYSIARRLLSANGFEVGRPAKHGVLNAARRAR